MTKTITNTIDYFQAPKNYFWRWAENGKVIEWKDGTTVCYREDVIAILHELCDEGFCSLGPILMILLACREKVNIHHKFFIFRHLKQSYDIKKSADDAFRMLEMITSLPEDLKKGKPRIHLIREIIGRSAIIHSKLQAREIVDEFNSGRHDADIFKEGPEISDARVKSDLGLFSKALQRCPDEQALEVKLRTGLRELPEAATGIIPDVALGLLEQLAADPETAGISRLAKRLVAALNIPMHSSVSGDQSYGGITDITNRGSYDRLLLSELAHDHDVLMARLVNNEALYFRREEPPDNPKRQRTILMDTTLKMWGVPRVFATSAALAFTQNTKHEEIVEAYALSGESYTEIELDTKEGIIKSLEQLDHSLQCGKALEKAVNEVAASEFNDFIFITDEINFNNPLFHSHLSVARESLGFILTLNRNGEIWFYECKKGRTKLLSKAKLDLEETLFAPIDIPRKQWEAKQSPANIQLAFLEQHPAPLLFPKVRIKVVEGKVFGTVRGAVVINENQRVLLVPGKGSGAYELLDYIEKGTYAFGFNPPDNYFLTVTNFQRKFFKLYHMKFSSGTHTSINLSDEIQYARDIFFHDNKFYIRTPYASFILNCESATVIDKKEYEAWPEMIPSAWDPTQTHESLTVLARIIDPHDSVMYNVKQLYISDKAHIVIGNYTLRPWRMHDEVKLRVAENTVAPMPVQISSELSVNRTVFRNKNIKFTTRRWDDGSEAIIDTRGFLHLKSSDPSIPQISIALVTGAFTACWASDGDVCGEPYFIYTKGDALVSVERFYQRKIQRFIDHILGHK